MLNCPGTGIDNPENDALPSAIVVAVNVPDILTQVLSRESATDRPFTGLSVSASVTVTSKVSLVELRFVLDSLNVNVTAAHIGSCNIADMSKIHSIFIIIINLPNFYIFTFYNNTLSESQPSFALKNMKTVSRFWYQLRAPFAKGSDLLDNTGARFSLAPLQANMDRIIGINRPDNNSKLTPLEVSFFLYEFANQRALIQKQQALLAEKRSEAEELPVWSRTLRYFTDSEFRNLAMNRSYLQSYNRYVENSFQTLVKLLQYSKLEEVPVAVVSNTLYASVKLDLDIKPYLETLLLPVLKSKAEYLDADELAKTVWALSKLHVNDTELVSKLLELLKGRKFSENFTRVIPSAFHGSQYQVDPTPETLNHKDLLSSAALHQLETPLKGKLEEVVKSLN